MDQQSKTENSFSLFIKYGIFAVVSLLVFIFPLKFSLPFAEGFSAVFPLDFTEWVFFSWPEFMAYALILAASLLTLLKIYLKKELVFYKDTFSLLLMIFFLLVGVSFFFSLNHYRSTVFFIRFVSVCILYFVVKENAVDFKLWRFIVIVMIASAIVVSVYGLYQFFYGLNDARIYVMKAAESGFVFSDELMQRLSGNRIFSTFVYPNALSAYLLFVLPMIFFVILIKDKGDRVRFILYPALIAFLCMGIFFNVTGLKELVAKAVILLVVYPITALWVFFLTLSKGGFVSLFLGFITCLFFYRKVRRKKIFLIGALVLLGGLLVVYAFPDLRATVFLRLKAKTLAVRFDYWQAGFKMFADYFLLGTGSDNFGLLYPLYAVKDAEITQMAHNNYLQIFVENGLLGGIVFLCMALCLSFKILITFKNINASDTDNFLENQKNLFKMAVGFGILCTLIHWVVDFDIYIYSLFAYFFIFAALFFAWDDKEKKKLFVLKGGLLKGVILSAVILSVLSFNFLYKNYQADLYFFKATSAASKGVLPLAVKYCKKAENIKGETYVYHTFLSKVFYTGKHYQASLFHAQRSLELNKYQAKLYKQIADIYQILGKEKKDAVESKDKIEDSLKKACFYAPHKLEYKKALEQFYKQ